MLKFQLWLHAGNDEDFLTFTGVASESDHLPIGNVRAHWHPNALEQKDEEIAAFEDLYRKPVVEAAKRIKAKYE